MLARSPSDFPLGPQRYLGGKLGLRDSYARMG